MSEGGTGEGPLPERYRPRAGRVVLLVALLAMLNLPVLLSVAAGWRLAAEGIDTRGEVVDSQRLGTESRPLYFISFRMPDEVDPRRTTWRTEMEPAAYVEAERTGQVSLTVLPGDPSSFEVDGTREGREGLWFTLAADAVLVVGAVLAYRYGRRGHAAERRRRQRVELSTGRPFHRDATLLRLVAASDLRPAPRGEPHRWERQDDATVEVCGEVVAIRDDEVELQVGGRRVAVALAAHRNDAAFRGVARVRVRHAGPGEDA